jgi:tetratricopeptide (TPR) repeat protein
MRRDDYRPDNFIPLAMEFIVPAVEWQLAELYGKAGDDARRRAKLASILKFCDGARNPAVPAELYSAIRAIVHLASGDRPAAVLELEKVVRGAEQVKAGLAGTPLWDQLEAIKREYPYVVWTLGPLAIHTCDLFEQIDADLGARWAAVWGLDRTREVRIKRVARAIEARDFEGALKLAEAEPLLKADVLAAQGNVAEAIELCDALRKQDPWRADVYERELRLVTDKSRAAALLAERIERDRFDGTAMVNRARLLAELGRPLEARIDAERAMALRGPDRDALAVARAIKAEPDATLNAMIAREPRAAWLYAVRGTIEDLTRAVELRPDYAHAFVLRGLARAAKGEHESAAADLGRGLTLDGSHVEARVDRAESLIKLGRKAEAERELREYLRREPKGARADRARDLLK